MENWKDVIVYECIYQISNLGRVKSLSRSIIRSNGKIQTFKEGSLKLGLADPTLVIAGVGGAPTDVASFVSSFCGGTGIAAHLRGNQRFNRWQPLGGEGVSHRKLVLTFNLVPLTMPVGRPS